MREGTKEGRRLLRGMLLMLCAVCLCAGLPGCGDAKNESACTLWEYISAHGREQPLTGRTEVFRETESGRLVFSADKQRRFSVCYRAQGSSVRLDADCAGVDADSVWFFTLETEEEPNEIVSAFFRVEGGTARAETFNLRKSGADLPISDGTRLEALARALQECTSSFLRELDGFLREETGSCWEDLLRA